MKHAVLASIFFAVACNALADEPYKHQYVNGGYYDAMEQPVATAQESEPLKFVSKNGGALDLGALPPTAAGPALPLQHVLAP